MGQQVRMWLGAGVLTAGVSGALIAGAGVAAADTESAQSNESTVDSGSTGFGPKQRRGAQSESTVNSGGASERAERRESRRYSGTGSVGKKQRRENPPEPTTTDPDAPPTKTTEPREEASAVDRVASARSDIGTRVAARLGVVESARAQTPAEPAKAELEPAAVVRRIVDDVTAGVSIKPTQLTSAPSGATVKASAAEPALTSVANLIGSPVFNLLGAAERLVVGPPVVPPGSTVTVKSSTLEIGNGHVVPADWYYPETDVPPERLIYLQHGFLVTGPMYSYTAAYLAEGTNSIVVAPSLTSNPVAADSMWLGGDGMHRAVADLFVGKREELTDSALAAGYAEQYGLEPEEAALPQQFALVGHSLGGGLVAGVAGYTVDNGAAADLVGVILLDGVPPDGVLPNALDKLEEYEQSPGGRYIPVRAIGAPANAGNSPSNVNQELSEARPDRFNGIVVVDGGHLDAMQGGNPIIQLVVYVVAGNPQPQNPAAVRELAITWLNEWFEGDTDAGDDLVPGSTIDLNEEGTAHGIVIGEAPATSSSILGELLAKFVTIEPMAASSVVSPRNTSLAGYWLNIAA